MLSSRRPQIPRPGVQPCRCAAVCGPAPAGYDCAGKPFGNRQNRSGGGRCRDSEAQPVLGRAAHPRVRIRLIVLFKNAPRNLRRYGARRKERSGVAHRDRAGHARYRHGACGAGERDIRRVGPGGRKGVRDEPGICRLYRRRARGRCGRDGRCILRCAQGPSRS